MTKILDYGKYNYKANMAIIQNPKIINTKGWQAGYNSAEKGLVIQHS